MWSCYTWASTWRVLVRATLFLWPDVAIPAVISTVTWGVPWCLGWGAVATEPSSREHRWGGVQSPWRDHLGSFPRRDESQRPHLVSYRHERWLSWGHPRRTPAPWSERKGRPKCCDGVGSPFVAQQPLQQPFLGVLRDIMGSNSDYFGCLRAYLVDGFFLDLCSHHTVRPRPGLLRPCQPYPWFLGGSLAPGLGMICPLRQPRRQKAENARQLLDVGTDLYGFPLFLWNK